MVTRHKARTHGEILLKGRLSRFSFTIKNFIMITAVQSGTDCPERNEVSIAGDLQIETRQSIGCHIVDRVLHLEEGDCTRLSLRLHPILRF